MTLRKANSYQVRAVEKAERTLRDALILAKIGNSPKLCARIRLAIKSAGGAVRHVHRRFRARQTFGVLHVTNTERAAVAAVESPKGYLNARRVPESPGNYRWQRIHQ